MNRLRASGFTIVEVLIVVVVIAILAAVTIFSYNAITRNANEAAMKSDLKTATSELGLFFFENKRYPSDAVEAGLEASKGNTLTYVRDGAGYCVEVTSTSLSGASFFVTQDQQVPEDGSCV